MKQALTGGAYTARSVIAAAQRSLNLFSEPMPQQQGEPMPAAHYPTPGLTLMNSVGSGPIRGIHQATNGQIYVVSGSTVYLIDGNGWTGTALGNITAGLTTPVSMQDNGLDLIIVDGSANGWDVSLSSNTFTQIPTTTIVTPETASTTAVIAAGGACYTPFVAPFSGSIPNATVSLNSGYVGNMQVAIFASYGDVPTSVAGLAANVIVNPGAGDNLVTFTPPVPVTQGVQYFIGFDSDTTSGAWNVASGLTGRESATPYADFPTASPPCGAAPAVVCSVTVSNDAVGMFGGADRVEFLDTYLIFNRPASPQFYISGSLAVTFDPLDFANKEDYPDLLVTLCVAKREIWLLGQLTTEIWYDAGATDTAAGSFPFAEVQGVFVDHGITAKYSVATYDNSLFWLTSDRQGQGFVIMGAGYQTKRVSTYALEAELATYAKIWDAIGFTYLLAGHAFYVLTFPSADKTWVYDVGTQLWHQWAWIDNNGAEHRHRANCCWTVDGIPVVGDWQNGNLYVLDRANFTDNGQPIKRLRSFPHLLADGKRVFHRAFVADLETGGAQPDSGTPAQALISLAWSDDRGHSFGSPVTQPMGAGGEYLTSLLWRRLGMARDRVYQLSWSTPFSTALQGCWLEAEPADSTEPAQQEAQG